MTTTVARSGGATLSSMTALRVAKDRVRDALIFARLDVTGVDVRGQYISGPFGTCDNQPGHADAVDEVTWTHTESWGEQSRYLVQCCRGCTPEVVAVALSGGTDSDVRVWAGVIGEA